MASGQLQTDGTASFVGAFRKMILKLSQGLNTTALGEFKFACGDHLSESELEEAKRGIDVFQILTRKGKISETEVGPLLEIFDVLQRFDLEKIVKEYQDGIKPPTNATPVKSASGRPPEECPSERQRNVAITSNCTSIMSRDIMSPDCISPGINTDQAVSSQTCRKLLDENDDEHPVRSTRQSSAHDSESNIARTKPEHSTLNSATSGSLLTMPKMASDTSTAVKELDTEPVPQSGSNTNAESRGQRNTGESPNRDSHPYAKINPLTMTSVKSATDLSMKDLLISEVSRHGQAQHVGSTKNLFGHPSGHGNDVVDPILAKTGNVAWPQTSQSDGSRDRKEDNANRGPRSSHKIHKGKSDATPPSNSLFFPLALPQDDSKDKCFTATHTTADLDIDVDGPSSVSESFADNPDDAFTSEPSPSLPSHRSSPVGAESIDIDGCMELSINDGISVSHLTEVKRPIEDNDSTELKRMHEEIPGGGTRTQKKEVRYTSTQLKHYQNDEETKRPLLFTEDDASAIQSAMVPHEIDRCHLMNQSSIESEFNTGSKQEVVYDDLIPTQKARKEDIGDTDLKTESEHEALSSTQNNMQIVYDRKKGKSPQRRTLPEKSQEGITLWKYQKELAHPAIKGENSIVCSPTGSGKTILAAHVCRVLYERAKKEKKRFKALFIVCIRNLVRQQTEAFRKLFPEDGVVGEVSESQSLKVQLESTDIVLLTAQILVNDIKQEQMKINDLDLLIMDECHHANLGHPYIAIMRLYFEEKRRGVTNLPQILGLTASLGVGEEIEPVEHYIRMCANLDCFCVTHVRNPDNKRELIARNPKPGKDQIITVEPRSASSPFLKRLTELMRRIEASTTLPPTKHNYDTQGYENFIVEVAKEAQVQKNREVAEKVDDNPMLQKLYDLLYDLYASDRDSNGIVLTRTRDFTKGLLSCITDQINLEFLVYADRLTGQAPTALKGMTDRKQLEVLERFRKGHSAEKPDGINLLVATDVAQEGLDMPECNFIIRYDFVSNEIGTVQSKGRARAKNSECYLIVKRGSINETREYYNLAKEHAMLEALDEIDKLDEAELHAKIKAKQNELWDEYQAELARKQKQASEFDPNGVEIFCKECHFMICKGTDILKKGSNYICTDTDFPKRVSIKRLSPESIKEFRTDIHVAVSACPTETCHIQFGPVLEFKCGSRRQGYVLTIKSLLFQYEKEAAKTHCRQWSKVKFNVPEELMER